MGMATIYLQQENQCLLFHSKRKSDRKEHRGEENSPFRQFKAELSV